MAVYLLRRVGETLITLLLVTLLVFCLTRLTGDPTTLLLGPEASDEARAYFRHYNNLDRSLVVQYITYLQHAIAGDFGTSFRLNEPAIKVVFEALGPTLKLAGLGMLLSILIGMPLGIWAAASRFALRQASRQLVCEPRAGAASVLERADAGHAVCPVVSDLSDVGLRRAANTMRCRR